MAFWPAIIQAAGQIVASAASRGGDGGRGGGFGGTATTEQLQLGPESERELMLALLAERLGAFGGELALGGGPISLDDLIAGRIGEAQRTRMDQLVFGDAFQRAIRDAERVARESAASRGLGGGSGEMQFFSRLAQPLLASAAQSRIGLEMGELERMAQLRENMIANALAFQNMPALNRLTGLRMATGTRRQFQATQPVGKFTPFWQQTEFVNPEATGIGPAGSRSQPPAGTTGFPPPVEVGGQPSDVPWMWNPRENWWEWGRNRY